MKAMEFLIESRDLHTGDAQPQECCPTRQSTRLLRDKAAQRG